MFVSFELVLLFTFVSCKEIRQDIESHPSWKLLDTRESCGYSSTDRIIGGYNARLGQYPWIARVKYSVEPDFNNHSRNMFNCGGSIISQRYILLAAHCLPKFMTVPDGFHIKIDGVRLGEFNANSDPDCEDGVCAPPVQDIKLVEQIYHRGYNNRLRHFDICLFRLAEAIQFSRFVYPICLPIYKLFQHNDFVGKKMEVAGWGMTDVISRTKSDLLMKVKIPVVSHQSCQRAFVASAYISERTQLCAGGVVGKDTCAGDSGGPLVVPFSVNGPPRYFQVGIVSYGVSMCATLESPGVYTKVAAFMTWILDNVRE